MAWDTDLSNTFGGFGNGTITNPVSVSTNAASSQYQPQTSRQEEDARNQFAVLKQQADRDYSLRKRELDQQKEIAKATAKTAAERNAIDKWYNQQQVQLAQQRLAQEQQQFTARLEFDKQTEAHQFGLAQARQGYDLLGMQAQLRGPENYYQAAELQRGVAAQPGTATFLKALQENTHLAPYVAPAGVPDRANVNALASRLGYAGPELVPGAGSATAGAGTNDEANLASIRAIGAAGAHKLGAGSLERLTDTEQKLLQSGLGASGFDVPSFLQSYRRSRIGQSGYGNVAAA